MWGWSSTRSNDPQFAQIKQSTSSFGVFVDESDGLGHELLQCSTCCLVLMVIHELCGGDGVREAKERGGKGEKTAKNEREKKEEDIIRVRVLIFYVRLGGYSTKKGNPLPVRKPDFFFKN